MISAPTKNTQCEPDVKRADDIRPYEKHAKYTYRTECYICYNKNKKRFTEVKMPRPTKEFLDYFPFYCRGDERTDILKPKKGMTGFGVYVSLLVKLYGEKGYYLNWNDNVCCIFSNSVGISESEVRDIVDLLINIGLFDKDIFDRHGVLTSKEIQENYLFAISKRKNKSLDKRYDLVSVEETPVSGEETAVSGEETRVSVTESTQRKENKRKENKIKENKIKEECVMTAVPSPPTPGGEFQNVILTEDEYERLKERFSNCDRTIERLSQYMAATGKQYNSHYAVIKQWATEDKNKGIPPTTETDQSFDVDEFYQAALKRSRELTSLND